jgi:hypothetical protein
MLQKLNPGPDCQEQECYPHLTEIFEVIIYVRIMFDLLFSQRKCDEIANACASWAASYAGRSFEPHLRCVTLVFICARP